MKKIAFYSLALFALVSCAQEVNESSDNIQKRILDAYIAEYCPDAEQMESGLTYLEKSVGTGKNEVEELNAVYVNYSTRSLSGEYTATNSAELAKLLGFYNKTSYYGPKLYQVGYGNTYLGLEEMLLGMKKGAKATAIIPPWLTATESSSSQSSSVNSIYSIELVDIVTDINEFQLDSMASYAKYHLNGLDTTSYGFYYKLNSKPTLDTLKRDDVLNIRYIGRLLDGFIFDTNIMDSAKVHGIYNSANTYAALEATYDEDLDTFVENSGLVKGFCMALQKMNYEETATTMFISDYGYGTRGSGSNIGAFQPLIFDIYLEPKEVDETE